MKWRNSIGKRMDDCKKHKAGDERCRKVFALLPTNVGGTTVWFENYYVHEVWYEGTYAWLNPRLSLHDGSY